MDTLTSAMAEARWQDADAEVAFWQEHLQEYLERYPDQYVAVHNGAAVAADADLRAVLDQLTELGLEPRQVWLHYFATHPTNFIF